MARLAIGPTAFPLTVEGDTYDPAAVVTAYQALCGTMGVEPNSSIVAAIPGLTQEQAIALSIASNTGQEAQLSAIAARANETVDAITESLAHPWPGAWMAIGAGGGASATTDTAFLLPDPEIVFTTGLDVRAMVRPLSGRDDGEDTFTEIFTRQLVITPPEDEVDGTELAVWWQSGYPWWFLEFASTADLTQEQPSVSAAGAPVGLWSEVRALIDFDNGDDGHTVVLQRRTHAGWDPTDPFGSTTDGKRWRTIATSTREGTTDLAVTEFDWAIGFGQGRVDVGWVEIRNGVDGTLVSAVNADDATDASTVPDSVLTGEDWASVEAEVVEP